MNDNLFGGIIITIVLVICASFITWLAFAIENNEVENFWSCKDHGGTTEYCKQTFEHDNQMSIDDFDECMIEINNLEFCYDKFLYP